MGRPGRFSWPRCPRTVVPAGGSRPESSGRSTSRRRWGLGLLALAGAGAVALALAHPAAVAGASAPRPAPPETPTAKGYWLAGADGGVFSFGTARYFGSMAHASLAAPVVGIAPTRSPLSVPSRSTGGPTTGGLVLTVSNVPTGATPSILVSGPGGYRATPSGSATLTGLLSGNYVVSAKPVSQGGATYYPSVSASPATVQPGQLSQVTVSYLDEVLDTTKVVPAGVAADLTAVSADSLTFTVGATVPSPLATLQVGYVLVFGISATTPDGLLVRVTSVTEGNGQVIVGTAHAGLADAVPQGAFSATDTLTDTQITSSVRDTPGVTLLASTRKLAPAWSLRSAPSLSRSRRGPAAAPAWERNDFGLTFTTTLSCGGGPEISLGGTVHFSPSFHFSATWSVLTGLHATVSGSLTEETHLSVKAGGVVGCTAKFLLDTIDFEPIDVQIGPVPVVIFPTVDVYVLITAEGLVKVTWGASYTQTSTVSAGLAVHNGTFTPFSSHTQSVQSTQAPTTPEAGFSVKVAVGPTLDLLVYDVAGPEVNLDGFVTLDIAPTSSPWWKLEAGLEAGAGFTITLGGLIKVVTISDPGLLTFAVVIAEATPGQSAPPPQFTTTTTLPGATVGEPYTLPIAVTGGAPPYEWSALGLPSGLSLDGTTGVLSGTPQYDGTSRIPVTVKDSIGHQITRTFTLVVTGPTITTTFLPDAEYEVPYRSTLQAAGGVGTLTWSVSTTYPNALPTGVTLTANGSQAVLQGSPTAGGFRIWTPTFTVTDQNGNAETVTLTIVELLGPAIWTQGIGNTTLPNGQPTPAVTTVPRTGEVSVPYQAQWVAGAAFRASPLTWSLASGSLPTGVSGVSCADPPHCYIGRAEGTPTRAGTYTFTVEITDPLGGTATQTDTVSVHAVPTITTTSLGTHILAGTPYQVPVSASGGTGPYAWHATSSGFRSVSVSGTGASATVSFTTTTTPGTYGVTLSVTDADGLAAVKTLTLHVAARPPIAISPSSLPGADDTVPYDVTFGATGGSGGPYTFSISGSLPTGVSFDCSPSASDCTTATLKGTPRTTGTFSVDVTATDFAGHTGTAADTLKVATPLVISTTSLPPATVNPTTETVATTAGTATAYARYTASIRATQGTEPIESWTVSAGSLPAGLGLSRTPTDPTVAVVSGTPSTTPAEVAKSSTFTVTATDAAGGTAARQFTLGVPLLLVTTAPTGATLREAQQGVFYRAALSAVGGSGPYAWRVPTGAAPLPAWSTGPSCADAACDQAELSGVPTATGTFSVDVEVSDPTGATAVHEYELTVVPPPRVPPGTLPTAEVGVYYAEGLFPTGGSRTPQVRYTWTLTATAKATMPPGLTLAATGLISGTPTASGTDTIPVVLKEYTGTTLVDTTNGSLTLGVAPHVVISPTIRCYTFGGPERVVRCAATLPPAEVGVAYSFRFSASTGVVPYSFSALGTLPPGLTLSQTGATVLLSGTPTEASPSRGAYGFGIAVTDARAGEEVAGVGGFYDANPLTVYPALSLVTAAFDPGENCAPYSQTVSATGGDPPYTWSATGLPSGLSLTPATGTISGVPKVAPGTYPVTLSVTDQLGVDLCRDRDYPDTAVNEPGGRR